MSDHGFADLGQQATTGRLERGGSERRSGSSGRLVKGLQDKTVISRPTPVPVTQPAPASDEAQELLGEKLGHFLLHEFVGGGGMGAVFRGHDTKLDRPVAVKVLARHQSLDQELVRRFQNEARSAARLDHENVARVYDFGEDGGWHYIVFEFVDGQNIRDLVAERGPVDVPVALGYVRQIAEALQHASQRNVVHRDVKPSNVVITETGRVKLVDMGLARLHRVEGSDDLTASGVTLGTFDYISPEQARDPRLVDVRSDLYSLGCTLYFMLTGMPPFPHGSAVQKLLSHSNDPPPDPRNYREDIPEEVIRILERMLAKDPEQRYQQPVEVIADIAFVAKAYDWELPGPTTRIVLGAEGRSGSWWERHAVWLAPVVLLSLLLVGLELVRPPVSDRGLVLPRIADASSAGSPDDVDRPRVTSGTASGPTPRDPAGGSPSQLPRSPSDVTPTVEPRRVIGLRPGSTGESVAGGSNQVQATVPDSLPAVADATGRSQPRGAVEGAEDRPNGNRTVPLTSAVSPSTHAPPAGSSSANSNIPQPAATNGSTWRIVVDPFAQGPRDESAYSVGELEVALQLVQEGQSDRIELHYNGRPPTSIAKALRLIDRQNVTLVAGPGYRPVVAYRPSADALLTLENSSLTVENVHFELDFPPDSMAGGALFRLDDCRSLALHNCTMTVRTSDTYYGTDAAVFDVRSRPMGSPADVTEMPRKPLRIQMRNCVVRGETTLVRAVEGTPLDFLWWNGLFASGERMFHLGGASNAARTADLVRIDLARLTAHARGGLLLLTNDRDRPHLLPVDLYMTDSIVITNKDRASLVEQRGPSAVQEYQAQVTFHGERNFYEGVEVFWDIASQGQMPRQLDFDEWRDYWKDAERSPRYQQVHWERFPRSNLPFADQLPTDYLLEENPSNPAHRSTPDMQDAGLDLPSLPQPPLEIELPAGG